MLNFIYSILLAIPALIVSNVLSLIVSQLVFFIPFLQEQGHKYGARFLMGVTAGVIFGTLANYGFNTYVLTIFYLTYILLLAERGSTSDRQVRFYVILHALGFILTKPLIEVLF